MNLIHDYVEGSTKFRDILGANQAMVIYGQK